MQAERAEDRCKYGDHKLENGLPLFLGKNFKHNQDFLKIIRIKNFENLKKRPTLTLPHREGTHVRL